MNKKTKTLAAYMLAIAGLTTVFTSCNEENDEVKNGRQESYKKENVSASDGGITITILDIGRGKKKGKWPHQTCDGGKGVCFIWFGKAINQTTYSPEMTSLSTANIIGYVKDSTITLNIDFSDVEDIAEKSIWQEEVSDGYIELYDDIVVTDAEFLNTIGASNSITLSRGKYYMFNVNGDSFSITIPYI